MAAAGKKSSISPLMALEPAVQVRNFTRREAPVFPYKDIAEVVLPGWEISLVFAGETRAKNLNIALRNKTYTPNVLSYAVGKKSGEIIICLNVAEKQAQSYGVSYEHFVVFLFIHGLLHLKGLPHGTTMEKHEQTFFTLFTGKHFSYDGESPNSVNNHGSSSHRNRH
jgi:rRNA maturation RNase YbeY